MGLVKLYTFTFLGKKKITLTGRQSSSGPKHPQNTKRNYMFETPVMEELVICDTTDLRILIEERSKALALFCIQDRQQ